MKTTFLKLSLSIAMLAISANAFSQDTLTVKTIGMELARDMANDAVLACRKAGYQVSAVVVDRGGNMMAALRDTLASRFTLQVAEEKANASIFSGINSGDFRDARKDIQQELNHVNGIIIMEGGLPIEAGGSRIGAIGVSGAPGGDKDEACAMAAIKAAEERLEFAD
jgi:uncharacterized protein GlcG (DUF336 family)